MNDSVVLKHFMRAEQKRTVLLIVLMLTISGFSASVEAQSTGVMFHCNPQHTGVCETKGVQEKATEKWKFKTGNLNRSTPAVADGTVYVGSNNGKLYAVTAATGKLKWIFWTGGELSSSPAVVNGLVSLIGGDGDVYALNASTGRTKWTFKPGRDLAAPVTTKQWDFYQSSPTVADGVIYVGSGDGNIYALKARTGKLVWKFRTAGRVRSTPAVADGVVYCGSMDGNLYALDATTGRLQWKFKTAGNSYFPLGEVQSSPAVADGMVYFGSRDGFLYAVDIKTGGKKWAVDHQGSWVISTPAVADGVVFYGTSDGRTVQAMDAKTGKEKWKLDAQGRVFSSPIIVGGRVYIGLCSAATVWLEASSGKMTGYASSEGTIYSSPTVANGVLYYTSDDGYLYAVE